ncbi:uncharacterized protein LOC143275414 [Babylonia areolata]|uniref:uncharacterized protein LOC143275414 n=1 Tax=Babylonia areolata TaxID=304850 RepID=UPI003FD29AF6
MQDNMGSLFSSPPSPTRSEPANVSLNEGHNRRTVLSYTVDDAKEQDCSLKWINEGEYYRLVMEASGKTTKYTHTSKPVPADVRRKLGTPSKSKSGRRAVFTFTDNGGVSFQPYI